MADNKLAATQSKLNDTKMAFSKARLALASALTPLGAKESACNKLLDLAQEYGVDHAMKQLIKNPEKLDLESPLSTEALNAVRTLLEATHLAGERLDLAMAAHEDLARQLNPRHTKAFMLDGRETVYDPKANTLTDRTTHAVAPAHARTIETADYDNDADRS